MPNEESQPTCEERVAMELESRIHDLRQLWRAHCQEDFEEADAAEFENDYGVNPNEDREAAAEIIYDFGLSFDYVAPETFTDQLEPYWRYQLSWGGPSDEFRFYSGGPQVTPYRIEYWFLDWWDGASRTVAGDDLRLLHEYWQWFSETETTNHTQQQAMED